MNLCNKRILITAGPTWVPIDGVRVISNTASGKTGILLAEALQSCGAKVTLLLGPQEACCLNKKIRIISFKFFDELKKLIQQQLRLNKYDIVIHSAAVSDYRPSKIYAAKVGSSRKCWVIKLVPTPKLIDLIRKSGGSKVFAVGFKFETAAKKEFLINSARKLLKRSDLDLVVANTVRGSFYRAYIVGRRKIVGPFFNKISLTKNLIELLRAGINY